MKLIKITLGLFSHQLTNWWIILFRTGVVFALDVLSYYCCYSHHLAVIILFGLLGICDNVKSLSEALCIYNSSRRSTLIITQWTALWATWSSPWSMMWLETRSTFDCCLGTLDTHSWLSQMKKVLLWCFEFCFINTFVTDAHEIP